LERPGIGGGGTLNTTPQIQHNLFQNNIEYGLAFFLSSGSTSSSPQNTAILRDNIFRGNDIGVSINANSWGATIKALTQISNNTFSNNTSHNLYLKGKRTGNRAATVNPTIENNLFTNDVVTNSNNIYLKLEQKAGLRPIIRYNTIANAAYGVQIVDSGTEGAIDPDIHHNIFYGLDEYAIFNETARPISAEQNYWGSTEVEWDQGGSALVSGTGVITVANHLDLNSPPMLSRIEPGIAAAGDSLTLHGANFGKATVDVVINKSVKPQSALPGDPITYILSFSNQGTDLATGVLITDSIPVSVTHSSLSYTYTGAIITATGGAPYVWQVEDLAHNQGGVITISGVLSDALPAGAIINQASIAISATDSAPLDNGSSVSVAVQNVLPVASDDVPPAVLEDSSDNALDVLTNDTDDNGDALTVYSLTPPDQGGTALSGGTHITYTPAADFVGTETFSYTISDGNGGFDTAVVTVTVDNVNDAPLAADDLFTVIEVSSGNVLNVLLNDSFAPDSGETLTIFAIGAPDQGGTALNASTHITYTPAADFVGVETFTYTISDGNGGFDTTLVTVAVEAGPPPNAPPTLSGISNQATLVNTPITVSFTISDAETSLDSLTLSKASSNAALLPEANIVFGGSGAIRAAQLTPAAGMTGTATITLTVNDGELSASDSFILAVGANSPPEFTSSPVATATAGAQYIYNITATDPDASDTLSITAPTKPSWLTIMDNGDGTAVLSGVPQDSDAGQHSVTLNVTDGAVSVAQSFDVVVTTATTTYNIYLPAVMK